MAKDRILARPSMDIVTMSLITSTAACKSLFWGVVCCSPVVMCAVEWWNITLVTADEESTGCVQDGKTTRMPSKRFGLQSSQVLPSMQICLVYHKQCWDGRGFLTTSISLAKTIGILVYYDMTESFITTYCLYNRSYHVISGYVRMLTEVFHHTKQVSYDKNIWWYCYYIFSTSTCDRWVQFHNV